VVALGKKEKKFSYDRVKEVGVGRFGNAYRVLVRTSEEARLLRRPRLK
jgi:hypothetical protein